MADDITIMEAILGINPEAKVNVWDNDIDRIEWIVQGTDLDTGGSKIFTTPEINKSDILAKQVELQTDFDNAKTKKETDKANANQKLKDLGLTDDEIKAIKGIS